MIQLCPHKQNPKACVACYNAPKPAVAAAPTPRENAHGIPIGLLPGKRPPDAVGDRSGANVGVRGSGHPPVDPAEKAKWRGEDKPRPQWAGGPVAPPSPRTTTSAGTFDRNGLWVPDARPEIIDQQPRHPHAK